MHWGWCIFPLIFILLILWFLWGGEKIEFIGFRGLDFSKFPLNPKSEPPVPPPAPPSAPAPSPPTGLVIPELKMVRHKTLPERIACQAASEIYGVPFTSVWPDFLKNPETNRNLEIDCYNHDLKIGVEYNGPQHYVFPNHYMQSHEYDKFEKQLRRDQFKVEMCDRLGIYLITVPYTVPNDRIKDYIDYYRPESVLARLNHHSGQN